MGYIAFVHKDSESCFGVSFPDLPGCISGGDTLEEALKNATEAVAFQIEGMQQDGAETPTPRSMDEIYSDASLEEWREGAVFVYVPLLIDKGTVKRVNISLDQGILEAIDDAAKRRGITRSAFISGAARHELQG
ncbi:type II toxin-antitoxin system HicB family antitoxin [Candidatus Haliotispira prima]|uniref:Type II toxin-antitoxin system HicB family antitoxin n=1 Tax=Candidatus Haliotispira prima TaxID=3034016 RepID=A0ABY8MJY7_9SPIO|nr:type II toxin-antitoxin system HicB family antitoxin [Candidatus Haliotispira prima]